MYGAAFQSYDATAGEELSDKGSTNGTWGDPAVPTGAEAIAKQDDTISGVYMSVSAVDQGVVFTPDREGCRGLKSIMSTTWVAGFEDIPDLSQSDRAAFSIEVDEEGGRTFVGWGWSETKGKFCWQPLQLSEGDDSLEDGWRDVSIRFVRNADGRVRVQYRMIPNRSTSGRYVLLLRKIDGAAWMMAGGDSSDGTMVSSVEFRGEGALANLDGSEPKRGIAAGIGNWYETLFDETVVRRSTGDWSSEPAVSGSDFAIEEANDAGSYTFTPARVQKKDYVVTKVAARFSAPNDDDAYPDSACARVRLVEDEEGVCRFACLASDGWITNRTVVANVDMDYTLEIALDKARKHVSYRVKEGATVQKAGRT